VSTTILKLIPHAPDYLPIKTAQEKASTWLSSIFPDSSRIEVNSWDEVKFVDPGENFEHILCSFCNENLKLDWWHKVMDLACEDDFKNLEVQVPCCHSIVSLNELDYVWAAGFARFVLEIFEPNSTLSSESLSLLEQLLECRLRQIWARY